MWYYVVISNLITRQLKSVRCLITSYYITLIIILIVLVICNRGQSALLSIYSNRVLEAGESCLFVMERPTY